MNNKFAAISSVLALAAVVVPAQAEPSARYSVEGIAAQTFQENLLQGAPALSGYSGGGGIRGSAMMTEYLALEVSYLDYGSGEDSYIDSFGDVITNDMDSDSINVGIKGDFPLTHILSIIGRVGISMWDLRFSETDSAFPGDVFRSKDEGSDAYVGIGLQMNLENNLRLSVEYTEVEFSPQLGAATTDHRIESLSLSAGVRF